MNVVVDKDPNPMLDAFNNFMSNIGGPAIITLIVVLSIAGELYRKRRGGNDAASWPQIAFVVVFMCSAWLYTFGPEGWL
jgi:MFS superfamily sulfate permease-like transporter